MVHFRTGPRSELSGKQELDEIFEEVSPDAKPVFPAKSSLKTRQIVFDNAKVSQVYELIPYIKYESGQIFNFVFCFHRNLLIIN